MDSCSICRASWEEIVGSRSPGPHGSGRACRSSSSQLPCARAVLARADSHGSSRGVSRRPSSGFSRAALHRGTHEAPHQTAVARRLRGRRGYRSGHRKDDAVKSPFTNDVCWSTKRVCRFTSVVCSGTYDVRNRTSVVCNLPADGCNGTNGTDGLACVVCYVTQASDRFSYGYCGPTNIVRGPTNYVCGAVWPRFSRHFPITVRPRGVMVAELASGPGFDPRRAVSRGAPDARRNVLAQPCLKAQLRSKGGRDGVRRTRVR